MQDYFHSLNIHSLDAFVSREDVTRVMLQFGINTSTNVPVSWPLYKSEGEILQVFDVPELDSEV